MNNRTWLFALSLALIVLPSARADDHTIPSGKSVARPQGAAEAKRNSFFDGKEEVTWGFAGEPPHKDIFNGFLQGPIAGQINATVAADEKDSELKKRIYRGNALRISFDGLTFRKVKDHPELFELVIVGPVRTVTLKKKFSVEDLEHGRSFLDVRMPKLGRDLVGLGTAVGGGALSFHFDRTQGQLVVDEFKGDFALTFGLTQKDAGSMKDLKLVLKTLSVRPEMDAKFILPE